MGIFCIPTTEIFFAGVEDQCCEHVRPAFGYDSGDDAYDFISQSEYYSIADSKKRPIASKMNFLIHAMESSEAYYKPTSESCPDIVRSDINAFKWFLSEFEKNPSNAADLFQELRDKLTSIAYAVDSSPYYPESEFIYLFPEDMIDKQISKERYRPRSRRYIVYDAWQYCFATCEYLSFVGAFSTRLKKCCICGKYYVVPKSHRNSAYCSDECKIFGAKLKYNYNDAGAHEIKNVRSMLNRRMHTNPMLVKPLIEDFEGELAIYRDKLKEKEINDAQFLAWLKKRHASLKSASIKKAMREAKK